jgi:hypothetical protein
VTEPLHVNMYYAQNTNMLLREHVPLSTLINPREYPQEHARASVELVKTRRYWLRRYWMEEPSAPLFYLTLSR